MAQVCPAAKLERLLLPTDGSEFSEGAVREAINLAKTCSSKAIGNTVKNKNADAIVIGSHGRTALARLLMGSVTERVIGAAECAVLVVKVK